ncbi:MAG: HXXEE domain-containing protein [Terriglobia bacterium]
MSAPANAASRFGTAWLLLCGALALHVADEALTDFLSVYNPAVEGIRRSFPFFPMPTFTFQAWLAGLIAAVGLLSVLAFPAFQGRRWMVLLAYPFGILMLLNGSGHVAGSIYLGRMMPGVYTAPLLVGTSIYLLVRAWQARKLSRRPPEGMQG